MKKLLIVLGIIISIPVMAWLGINGLGRLMYNTYNCEMFNIDNIELRTGIDIPKIRKSDCTYDEETKIKLAFFEIDKEHVALEQYAKRSGLEKLSEITDKFSMLKDNMKDGVSYWGKAADLKNHQYQALLDINTGEIWIAIKYLD